MMITRRDFNSTMATVATAQAFLGIGSAFGADASSDELTSLSLMDVAAKIRSGSVTSTQVTQACLARIAVYDPKLDAFITVMKEQALAQARQLDAEQKAGTLRGPLHGVPVALKDNIDTAGTRTTAASALFEDRVPSLDAPVVTRLKDAGAVIIGKTNLHEFAMGGGDSSFWGPARNPWNLAHNTGGSSSGSGAAVCKIKIFAWRACVNGLPTKEKLCFRGINTNNDCPTYTRKMESIHHALLHCEFASCVWSF